MLRNMLEKYYSFFKLTCVKYGVNKKVKTNNNKNLKFDMGQRLER